MLLISTYPNLTKLLLIKLIKLNDFVKIKITEDTVLSIPLFTCDEVQKLPSEFNPGKATGLNGLSPKVLKLSALQVL